MLKNAKKVNLLMKIKIVLEWNEILYQEIILDMKRNYTAENKYYDACSKI